MQNNEFINEFDLKLQQLRTLIYSHKSPPQLAVVCIKKIKGSAKRRIFLRFFNLVVSKLPCVAIKKSEIIGLLCVLMCSNIFLKEIFEFFICKNCINNTKYCLSSMSESPL